DHNSHMLGLKTDSMQELGYRDRKRIHNLKYFTWIEQMGRSVEELDRQWYDYDEYWGSIHSMVPAIDKLIVEFNEAVGLETKG
ncbi:pyridoxal-5-phosphate-dependent protein subunit beta, partial [Candidatus Bipolaricaulota bacterium]|nr:pyridoxal-5-phosphate-dependent protein subunit beta [Candidatus Bipolaricaulota bacterium]